MPAAVLLIRARARPDAAQGAGMQARDRKGARPPRAANPQRHWPAAAVGHRVAGMIVVLEPAASGLRVRPVWRQTVEQIREHKAARGPF
jgi:hypothetical protein